MFRVLTVTAVFLAASAAVTGCGRDDKAKPARAKPPATTLAPVAVATPSGPPRFSAQISKIGDGALKQSWHPGCPVPLSGLRSIAMPYWGMDGKPHPGQLIVNAAVTGAVVKIFQRLWDGHYPIRLMQPVDAYKGSDFDSIEADNTSGFNCRNVSGSSSWSQHAYGLAIDINPCENPYVETDGSIAHPKCVIYGDRSRHDPGLIHDGDLVVRAFSAAGWGWGGTWDGIKDYQHFSTTGR